MVIGLLSEEGYSNEIEVLKDIQLLGGKTLTLGESGAEVSFDSGLPEPVRGVLYLPVLQLVACFRSISYGLNPDRPKNLTAVVEVNLKS
jgi:glutamine---fructose-6-phosphate transaminase (isomerizing)